MENVMKSRRITSIICATANNDVTYRDRHKGFIDFNHRLYFDEQEISILYPSYGFCSVETKALLMAKTAGMPLQVHKLVSTQSSSDYTLDFEQYEKDTIESICRGLDKLKKESVHYKEITHHACCCILSLPAEYAPVYDRNYLVENDGSLKPVFSLVLDAYQDYYWEEVMEMRRKF